MVKNPSRNSVDMGWCGVVVLMWRDSKRGFSFFKGLFSEEFKSKR